MSPCELSVVVITHNRAALVDEALAAIASQRWPEGSWELVVVDNESTDETPDVLKTWVEAMPVPMRIVRATDGRGPSYARNAGVRAARGTHMAFVDDDDVVGDGWVSAIGTALRASPLVASRFDCDRLNSPEVAAAHEVNVEGLPRVGNTPVASGAGLGCHRSLWESLGGNNEDLRYGEDIDFSLRASAAGVDPTFCQEAVYHFRLRNGARAAFSRGRHHGRASVDLYLRYGRERGARPDRFGLLARVWAGYLVRIPTLMRSNSRVAYAEQLGRRLGRLQGTVGERVWYP